MIIAVDPSIICTGFAIMDEDRLLRVGCAGGSSRIPYTQRIQTITEEYKHLLSNAGDGPALVLEWPEVYPDRKGKPNDLLYVSAVAGAVIGAHPNKKIFTYLPKTWKGQTPKEIHNQRIFEALPTFWQDSLEDFPAAQRHNVLDAIGIGWFHYTGVKL